MIRFQDLSPDEAAIWAAGYTEALADHQPYWDRLAVDARQQAAELTQARADSDRLYHQMYCGCEKTTVAATVKAIDTRANRAAWRAQYGMDAAA